MCSECKQVKETVSVVIPDYKDTISFEDINVSDNSEKSEQLIETYKITVVPTVIFLDKNGKIVTKYILKANSGWTGIFIYPGYEWRIIDELITNFHLPQSTLIMLVSALCGRQKILKAYREAVKERYRFFSFGDAMLIK